MNIKTSLIVLASALFTFFACSSTKEALPEKEMVKEVMQEKEKSLLWEIKGNNLEQSSFLFGTIHMIDSEDFFLPKGTLSAVDVTDKMIFEIDMAYMNDPMKIMPMMQKAFMKGDTTLQDLLSDADYALVKNHFSEMGLPIFFLERIKPMFLTVFASGDFNPGDMQSGKVKSYEMEFMKMAEEGAKETGGLETIEFQISVFDEIPYSDQATMLVEGIKSGGTEDDTFKELIAMYKDQDIYGLYDMMKTDDSIGDHEDVLLSLIHI